MIKAILFDLDNTLADFLAFKTVSSRAAIHAMVDAGLDMDKVVAYRELFAMYKEVGIEDQRIFNKFLDRHAQKPYNKLLAAGIIAYRKVKAGHLTTYVGVERTLLKLKEQGITLGVVSDAPQIQPWLRIEELGLREYFDVVVGFDDTKVHKPHEMPFRIAIERLGLKPEEVLFLGDNPARDIKGAQAIGMKTALAKYGQVFPDDGVKADYEIKKFDELLGILDT